MNIGFVPLQVNSGMASSFVQILSSIDAPVDPNQQELGASSANTESGNGHGYNKSTSSGGGSSRATTATHQRVALSAAEGEDATMHLMGSVTKKLVLTPAFDIGLRRQRAYSVNTQTQKGVPTELMYALGGGGGKLYPDEEEEVVMGEVV